MRQIIVLDSGPLGLVSNPKASPQNNRAREWLYALLEQDHILVLPEIADYEVRRELLRGGKVHGLARLNGFKTYLEYLSLDTA